ncbi:MAG TPA: Hsp70 family protein [Ramlibacter sp.]|nr:Hsp70 family protein [Ramlibacter sp.]
MTGRQPLALGIDFGTSNSAIAALSDGGRAELVPMEGAATTLPSAVFFNAEDRSIHFGREAVGLYLAATEGRLMRSLKSLLGSSLLQEKTAVPEGLVSFQDVISRFLAELRHRAERHLGRITDRVVIGRPVHFVDDDPARDHRAQAALEKAAHAAGFREVFFELEPIAAAFDFEQRVVRETLALIVDIGGGTSDFTVVRLGPERAARRDRADDILATTGVHIGGTDFDRKLSIDHVMPLLGLRHVGPQGREVPSPLFFDLATWHLINWLYTPKVWQQAQALRTNYSDPRLYERLLAVLQERLGHRLASEVERAKIRSSTGDDVARIDLSCLEPGLGPALHASGVAAGLAALLEQVVASALDCVRRAGLQHAQLDVLYLTGGSSALPALQDALRLGFPQSRLVEGDLFGGVASGLAYAAQRR